jgi:hypothetical protein
MSTELTANACPACGGDRVSIVSTGQLYCVDCNRKHYVFPSNTAEPESTAVDHAPMPKAA